MTISFRFADWPVRAKLAALLVAASLLPSLHDALEVDGHIVVSIDGGQAGIEAFNAACNTDKRFDAVDDPQWER
jgi:hypothetical protein